MYSDTSTSSGIEARGRAVVALGRSFHAYLGWNIVLIIFFTEIQGPGDTIKI